ncbi:MAG: hypothetical protein LBV30_04260, partial [Propionibacteriaceae bacterium]|nr:hypothetical protein [Propionibacteriaceae bacterium]
IDDAAVTAAVDNLTKVMNDPTKKTADIIGATAELDKLVRAKVIDLANGMLDQAKDSTVATDSNVVHEIGDLTGVVADNGTSVSEVVAATKELQDAVKQAELDRANAIKAAQEAISKADPVKTVPAVATAIANLQKVIADPKSTTAEIVKLTAELNAAVATASQPVTVTAVSANPPAVQPSPVKVKSGGLLWSDDQGQRTLGLTAIATALAGGAVIFGATHRGAKKAKRH